MGSGYVHGAMCTTDIAGAKTTVAVKSLPEGPFAIPAFDPDDPVRPNEPDTYVSRKANRPSRLAFRAAM